MAKVFRQITPCSIEDYLYDNSYSSVADKSSLARHSSSVNEGRLPRNLTRLDNDNEFKTSVCLESSCFGQV